MSEFDLIKQHFTRATRHTNLSVGDDAALITVSEGMELAISADMLVAGTHFFADADPYQLGWKALAVNVSDMAAMGANPKWATLAIALPHNDTTWLSQFSNGFFACAEAFDIDLIGGDTTRTKHENALTISVQIMGEVPIGRAIRRSGAQVGDDIWVSGTLGDAAFALAHMQGKLALSEANFISCSIALHTPNPRAALGLALRKVAHSAIDISDGLLADLGHILESSNLGAELLLENLPCSTIVKQHLSDTSLWDMVLAGGDDYELCFTAPIEKRTEITKLTKSLELPITRVGKITRSRDLLVLNNDLMPLSLQTKGFNHFS